MPEVTIQEVSSQIKEYMPDQDMSILEKAYEYANTIHEEKKRLSGDPYISHPLAVAKTLARMHLDLPTILSGLLHGVLKEEKTKSTEKELEKLFGEEVASIVNGATKITKVKFNNKLAYQAENVRKMLLAMSADIRVLLVKLADRLHDMQTLQFAPRRQKEIARETMDLYAPLASRLGIDWLKRELEDLSFSYIYPEEFADLSGRMATSTEDRQRYVDEVKKILYKELGKQGLRDFHILGRPKHLFSIYKKLIAQQIPLEKVYDKVAFRIIVNNVKECYEALGVVHSLWQPVSGRFKDFISTPKSNMYQSLHTSVVGPHGEFMEIQIRTEEMDRLANDGIAAHWAYKEGKAISKRDAKLFEWLKQLVKNIKEVEDPKEFLDAVKGELHEIEVYALTPNGEVKEFPHGSTPLDFAYSIHTEVGNRCIGAKVNNRMVPLRYQLKNGDLVEIITSPNQKPNRGWLSIVRTNRAKNRIRSSIKQDEQKKVLELGREICEREFRKKDISLKKVIKQGQINNILKGFACNTTDELLRKVGAGKIAPSVIIGKLQPEEKPDKKVIADQEVLQQKSAKKTVHKDSIIVDGFAGVLTNMSKCCMPVPGDEIMGFITAGRGVSIHKMNCKNLLASDPDRWIKVRWNTTEAAVHKAKVQVVAQDKKGLLATLSQVISMDNANIVNLEAKTTGTNLAKFNFIIEISNVDHLSTLLQHIEQIDGIFEAKRNN